jgi:hypothetical protein
MCCWRGGGGLARRFANTQGGHNANINSAPLDEFRHQTTTLDTLGLDAPEANCPRR